MASNQPNVFIDGEAGTTGLGAGRPGGAGVKLEFSHPRYVDAVAATYPELTIIASRPAWR